VDSAPSGSREHGLDRYCLRHHRVRGVIAAVVSASTGALAGQTVGPEELVGPVQCGLLASVAFVELALVRGRVGLRCARARAQRLLRQARE
jgi:hypothetical protein